MKYLSTYLIAAITLICLTAGFNWWIDPFGMYWSPITEGINKIKPEAGNRTRITKAYRATQVKPQVLMVGNSRVEIGLNPKHRIFNGQVAYNQGMPGAGLQLQMDYALNVIADTPNLHTIIIGVDFLDFLTQKSSVSKDATLNQTQPKHWARLTALTESSWSKSLFRLQEKAGMLLSLDALEASISTLIQQSAQVSSIDFYGFNTASTYVDIIHHEGIRPLFVQKLNELEKNLKGKDFVIKSDISDDFSPHFLQLKKLLEGATQRNISLHIFISPYHYSYLNLLDDLGYWENYAIWKRQLATLAAPYLENSIHLWDFSGFSQFVLERVPLQSPNEKMKWYWEPAHYNEELGDLLLEAMLNPNADNDFGDELSPATINTIIAQDKVSLENSKAAWVQLKQSLGIDLTSTQLASEKATSNTSLINALVSP